MNWIFTQDGTMEVQAELTGIMLAKGVHETIQPSHESTAEQRPHG